MLYKGKSLSCTKRSIGIHNVFVVFVTTKSGDFAERHGTIEHLEELGYLEQENVLQNEVKNQIGALYTENKAEYDALYDYISEIAADGKIMYAKTPKAKEYTIAKIIERMRSGNTGGIDAATPATV